MTHEQLNLGGLHIPPEAVTSTFGLLAVRGAGKTNAARVLAEEMFAAGLPFVAIDPVGSWFGLRAGSDGGAKGGLPVFIFGGDHGDVPITRGSGELVADVVVEQRLACIIDLSSFESEGDKKAFLLAFARRLYQKNRDPLHLFLEEADDYIPQKPMKDELQLMRAWENIVRRGRGRGIGMTLITQRSAVVNKDVLTQVETMFVMRTTGPQDLNAIEAWTKYHDFGFEALKTISGLIDGEAWVWSPHFLKDIRRFRFRMSHTFDSGATPKNFKGKDARKIATLRDVDVGKLKGRIQETLEHSKQDDPRVLKARIAELEAQLKSKSDLLVPVIPPELISKLDDFEDSVREALGKVHDAAERFVPSIEINIEQLKSPVQIPTTKVVKPVTRVVTGTDSLPKGELAVLTVIVQANGKATREMITVLTAYRRSTRDAYIQRLKEKGFIDGLSPTKAGIVALGPDYTPLPTGKKLRDYWLDNLPAGEANILSLLIDGYPKSLSRDELGSRLGFQRSTRDAYIQRLRAKLLVEGNVKASDQLF